MDAQRLMASTVLAGLTLLSACQPVPATPAPTAAPRPATAPAAPATGPTTPVASPTRGVPAAPAAATPVRPLPPAATVAPGAVLPFAAAPNTSPKRGGVLVHGQDSDPRTLDIHRETSLVALALLSSSYNGLLETWTGKIYPALAESYEVKGDGTEYIFRLRKDVKFHDGKPFTSEDAEFSLKRIIFPAKGESSRPADWLAPYVQEIAAVDSSTLRVKLAHPAASFLPAIANDWVAVAPKHVVEKKGDLKKDVVGTGPFKFVTYQPGVVYEVTRNPDYFVKGTPYLDGIRFFIVRDRAARLAAFITGRIDVVPRGSLGLSFSEAERVRKNYPNMRIFDYPAWSMMNLYMNVKVAPWNDVRVRRAVHLAVSRQQAVQFIYQRGHIGAFMPPGSPWAIASDELLSMPGYRPDKVQDLEEARRLLKEAGHAGGLKASLLTRASHLDSENASVFLQRELKKIGIDITIDAREQAATQEALFKRGFALAVWGTAQPLDDPDVFLVPWFGKESLYNYANVDDPQVQAMLKEQSATVDMAKRKEIVLNAQRRLIETAPWALLGWSIYWMGQQSWVQNYDPGFGPHNNTRLQGVWLSK